MHGNDVKSGATCENLSTSVAAGQAGRWPKIRCARVTGGICVRIVGSLSSRRSGFIRFVADFYLLFVKRIDRKRKVVVSCEIICCVRSS